MRLQLLLEKSTEAVYRAVSRGLFERHKLLFAFLLCTGILRAEGEVRCIMIRMSMDWSFFSCGLLYDNRCHAQNAKAWTPALIGGGSAVDAADIGYTTSNNFAKLGPSCNVREGATNTSSEEETL